AQPWMKDTTATSATFTGQTGKSYAFFSIARDQVGNLQEMPSAPDTTTRLGASPPGTGGSSKSGCSAPGTGSGGLAFLILVAWFLGLGREASRSGSAAG
ncbi:MAG: hypothetical protein ACXWK8_09800, partial [Myxococcaceae bacterium]